MNFLAEWRTHIYNTQNWFSCSIAEMQGSGERVSRARTASMYFLSRFLLCIFLPRFPQPRPLLLLWIFSNSSTAALTIYKGGAPSHCCEGQKSKKGRGHPPATIDIRRVRFLMLLPFLRTRTHLKWDVYLTHGLVDSAWLRRSFEAVREQVGLKGKRAGGKGLQRRNVGDL